MRDTVKGVEVTMLIVIVALLTVALAVLTGGLNSTSTFTQPANFTQQTPPTNVSCPVVINEFMAKNTQSTQSPTGNYSDWIELYNRADTPIDVGGMYLTDNLTDFKWQISTGTEIAGHGFLLVWADNNFKAGSLHTNFKLKASGEQIGLFTIDGTLVDSVVFNKQIKDISYGRTVDGGANWNYLLNPTPNEPNSSVNSLLSSYPWQLWVIVGLGAAIACLIVVFDEKLWVRRKSI
jgi:hypothetical protein